MIFAWLNPLATYLTAHVSSLFTTVAGPAAGCDPNRTFFGLPVWYKYIVNGPSGGACDFRNLVLWPPNDLILIAVAVVDMLLRLGGMVAVGFVIWGGISYVLSQGEPEKLKGALQTIINALIGLAIVLVSIGVVSFLGNKLA